MHYLLLVEGIKTEIHIFEKILSRYGLNVVRYGHLSSFSELQNIPLEITVLESASDNVIIAQAPRNRLKDLLHYYKVENIDLHFAFGGRDNLFNGIFLIFDVDHTPVDVLDQMFSIHCDETDSGLLLLSSPCIEILSEPERKDELHLAHLSDYKKNRNRYFSDTLHLGVNAMDYIAEHFEELAIHFLDKNYYESGDANVMNHPQFVVGRINCLNDRNDYEVVYRYFTTTVYVLIACVFRLNLQLENYQLLRDFLMEHM